MFGLGEIWGLLAIPLLFTVYLLVFHRKATVWWELAILWAVTIAVIPLCQMFAESYAISDHERWGFNTVSASYDQPFQYWDTCLTYEKSYYARLNYVHNNPVKHGLAPVADQYPFCSAAWFRAQADPRFRKKVESFRHDRVKIVDDF